MSETTLILLGAGNATRFDAPVKKQWLYIGNEPLWLTVAKRFERSGLFDDIVVTGSGDELHYMKHFADYTFVEGGTSRQASLKNALRKVTTPYVMVSDIARACVSDTLLRRLYDAKEDAACIVPYLPATDTVYMDDTPIDRTRVKLIQTPQLSRTEILVRALENDTEFTDDSSAIAALGKKVLFVEGETRAHKLTKIEDLAKLPCLQAPDSTLRVGYGIDIHPFEANKTMKLCGIAIESVDYGFKAHSDGDVAIHAIIDALLGAAGMGDIGELYPDTDTAYANADSTALLQDTLSHIRICGLIPVHLDITILAQAPKLSPYKAAMRRKLAELTGLATHRINIKATTAEKLGFVGRKEGVTVHATAALKPYDWTIHLKERDL